MGRSVLVTGGNRGIGLAIARAFQAAGDEVAVTHRGSGAPEGLRGVQCDVTDADQVAAAFDEVEAAQGKVEVLVANAGITDDGLLLRMGEEQFSRVVDANLAGSYRVAKRAASSMLRLRRGRMVFVSSVVGLSGGAGQANYAASKAAVDAMTAGLAKEVGPSGIRVNCIAPGVIDTDMNAMHSADTMQELADQTPLGRVGAAAEVADSILYLCSDKSSFITGQVLGVTGGF